MDSNSNVCWDDNASITLLKIIDIDEFEKLKLDATQNKALVNFTMVNKSTISKINKLFPNKMHPIKVYRVDVNKTLKYLIGKNFKFTKLPKEENFYEIDDVELETESKNVNRVYILNDDNSIQLYTESDLKDISGAAFFLTTKNVILSETKSFHYQIPCIKMDRLIIDIISKKDLVEEFVSNPKYALYKNGSCIKNAKMLKKLLFEVDAFNKNEFEYNPFFKNAEESNVLIRID